MIRSEQTARTALRSKAVRSSTVKGKCIDGCTEAIDVLSPNIR